MVGLRRWKLAGLAWGTCTAGAWAEEPVAVPIPVAPGTEVVEPAAANAAAAAPCETCQDGGFNFKKVPPVKPLPRIGNFPIIPSGPGYYSALDQLCGDYREGPPKYGYPRVGLMQNSFFDADFRYLDDPKNTDHDYADCLKRIHLGDDWLFSTGGDLRYRYMNEYNARLTTTNNDYGLARARVYGDLWYRDLFRTYIEYIGAYSGPQSLPVLPIDNNFGDFLNLFVDVKAGEYADKPIYVRAGRQELIYGSQRLISPLEWANTRRTFQGVKAFRQDEKWDFDAFWVQPVVPNATKLDSVDNNYNFAGTWATYKQNKTTSADFYYLMSDNASKITLSGLARAPFTIHTLGTRYAGSKDGFLWDLEYAAQLGTRGPENVIAGMATTGVGYHWKDAPLKPTAWIFYDYASGDNSPNQGTFHTFNQLFPFGHYYLGWSDVIGRQNIQDLNAHLFLYPTNWLTCWLQYHRFWLAADRDALYSPAGTPLRRSATGVAGNDVGQEVDLVLNFHLSKHVDLMTGYAYLFGGEFLQKTATATAGVDTSTYFLQLTYRW